LTYGLTEESPPTDARCMLQCVHLAENGCSKEILKRDSNRAETRPLQRSDEGREDPGDRVEWGFGNGPFDHPS
jgi:hypothetical protein